MHPYQCDNYTRIPPNPSILSSAYDENLMNNRFLIRNYSLLLHKAYATALDYEASCIML